MRKPRLIAILALTVLLLSMLGCQPGGKPAASQTAEPTIAETEETGLLNERQIRILTEQGLPTTYEALSLTQKSAIESIEDMLCYLEQRYEDRFQYVGYVADSPVEREHLLAASEAYPDCGPVTVYRSYENGSFRYEDNYSTLAATPLYEQALNDWIAQSIPDSKFIVFSEVSYADDKPEQGRILSQAAAASYILISEDACSEEELEALVDRFGPWIREQANCAYPNVTEFYLAAPELMAVACSETYEDLLPKLRERAYFNCSVSVDGDLKTGRRGG